MVAEETVISLFQMITGFRNTFQEKEGKSGFEKIRELECLVSVNYQRELK